MPPKPNTPHSRKSSLNIRSAMSRSPPDSTSHARKSEQEIARIKNKNTRAFYERQNRIIDRYLEVDHIIDNLDPETPAPTPIQERNGDEESTVGASTPLLKKPRPPSSNAASSPFLVHLAINLSFVINLVLFITKIFVALASGSLSVLASAFESFLDLLSNGIIFYTIRVIKKRDYYKYPVGKSRMEPLGIIVFAVITTTSFVQVLVASVERLVDPNKGEEAMDLSPLSLGLLIINIVVKSALWIWCRSIKGSSSVQALAQDHENDVVFNVASTIFPIAGEYGVRRIDKIPKSRD
ncbi:hypothetical protein BC938DRAFT_480473 [Jimgerdemannia flammicorona]|uniref:Cation efflux protein transmembrane domain-containing protein n=1 Tax=Jimgerdemannia flammicorona TaxID=994334 RepID=A0A433QIG3_9FUNG|nr:hypothetical protein BC938DRAFT_480473 [Jimgerdemannia flammicorona]